MFPQRMEKHSSAAPSPACSEGTDCHFIPFLLQG